MHTIICIFCIYMYDVMNFYVFIMKFTKFKATNKFEKFAFHNYATKPHAGVARPMAVTFLPYAGEKAFVGNH